MRIVRLVIVVAVVIALGACASTFRVRPESLDSTLVIGRYFMDDPPPSMKEVMRSRFDLELFVRSSDESSRSVRARITRYGTTQFMFTTSLGAGDWEIFRIEFRGKDTERRGKYTYEITRGIDVELEVPLQFTVRSGMVNNMGTIRFVFPESNKIAIEGAGDYEELQAYFRNSYEDSDWNEFTWLPMFMAYADG